MKPYNARHTGAAQVREALRALELDSCTSAESRSNTLRAHGSADFARNAPAFAMRSTRTRASNLATCADSQLSLGEYCAARR